MKRKATTSPGEVESRRPHDYYTQAFPSHCTLGERVLKRLFVQDPEKTLRVSDAPPEGECLIVGDDFSVILLRDGECCICLCASSPCQSTSGYALWWHDYECYLVQPPSDKFAVSHPPTTLSPYTIGRVDWSGTNITKRVNVNSPWECVVAVMRPPIGGVGSLLRPARSTLPRMLVEHNAKRYVRFYFNRRRDWFILFLERGTEIVLLTHTLALPVDLLTMLCGLYGQFQRLLLTGPSGLSPVF